MEAIPLGARRKLMGHSFDRTSRPSRDELQGKLLHEAAELSDTASATNTEAESFPYVGSLEALIMSITKLDVAIQSFGEWDEQSALDSAEVARKQLDAAGDLLYLFEGKTAHPSKQAVVDAVQCLARAMLLLTESAMPISVDESTTEVRDSVLKVRSLLGAKIHMEAIPDAISDLERCL